MPRRPSRLLYVDHIAEHGRELFEQVCALDLEGIVAKRRHSRYVPDSTRAAWYKI